MNKKLSLWYDNVLLRIGLVRLSHYTKLMERHLRMQDLVYNRDTLPAYSKGIH